MTKNLFLLTAALAAALPQAAIAQHRGEHGGPGGGGPRQGGEPHGPPPGGGAPHGPPPGAEAPHAPPPAAQPPRPDMARPQFQPGQRPEGGRGFEQQRPADRGQWRGGDWHGGQDRGADRPRGDWRGDRGPDRTGDRRGDWHGDRGPGWTGDHRGEWRDDRGPGWNSRDYDRGFYRIGGGRPEGFRRYHAPPFYYPRGWGYRRWSIGLVLPSVFLSDAYYWNDWDSLGIGAPPPGYHWVRYGPDLLLVSWRTGRIADVVYDAFY